MSGIYDASFNNFLQKSIGAGPTPGGASVSAAAATLAASMVGMVASLTMGKKAYAAYEEQAQKIFSDCQALIEKLKMLTQQDMDAYAAFMVAFRLPKSSDAEKAARELALEQAGKNASLVPVDICQACVEVIELGATTGAFGNKMAISDAGVGVHLALGACKASMLNVEINLLSLKDKAFIESMKARKDLLLARAEQTAEEAIKTIEQRMYS